MPSPQESSLCRELLHSLPLFPAPPILYPQSWQFTSKLEPMLVYISMEKQSVSLYEAWSMDSTNQRKSPWRLYNIFLAISLTNINTTSVPRQVLAGSKSRTSCNRKEILCNHKSTWICRLFLNYCYESSLIFFTRWNKYTLNLLCVWCIGGKTQASFVVSLYCQAFRKGGKFLTSRLAWAPLLNWTAMPGIIPARLHMSLACSGLSIDLSLEIPQDQHHRSHHGEKLVQFQWNPSAKWQRIVKGLEGI